MTDDDNHDLPPAAAPPTADATLASAQERDWRAVADINAAYARGELDDAGWHRAMSARIVPSYLAAPTPEAGSGHSGTADDWNYSRGIVAQAIDRSGTFLDVGCANGLLMESVERWARARGHAVEPFGIDISPELTAHAASRYPTWSDRFTCANALGYTPARRFDFVRTGLEYVPPARRRDLLAWLVDRVVEPGGRLIIGKYNEPIETRAVEHAIASYLAAGSIPARIAGRHDLAHRSEPRVHYRVVWLDVAP